MSISADLCALKEVQKFTWSQGDLERLAVELQPVAEGLVEAVGVLAADAVLDVAAGTGNVAVAAAQRGAHVAACDITPRMVELGRARSEREGVDIEWVEADAEALPFPGGRFDQVLSTFGVMFAPQPQAAAAELFRVAARGATVAIASWTPESFPGRLWATVAGYLPPGPDGVPAPMEWGIERIVRERLAGFAANLTLERRGVTMRGRSVEAMWEFLRCNTGRLVTARMVLGDRFDALAADVRALIAELNAASDGSAQVECGYLLAVASSAP